MIAGRVPFEGATSTDAIISIAEREPSQLASHTAGVPVQLERIVRKALAKEREERYQTVKDLGLDLKGLKRELEIEVELERTAPPESRAAISESGGIRTATETGRHLTSSKTSQVENLPTGVNHLKRAAMVGARRARRGSSPWLSHLHAVFRNWPKRHRFHRRPALHERERRP